MPALVRTRRDAETLAPLPGNRAATVSYRAHHLSAMQTIHASRQVGGTGTSGNI